MEPKPALFAALAKAQAQIKGAVKDSNNPFFKSKYADLASVWDACRAALTDHGLCVIQTTGFNEQMGVYIETTLGHSSGESISGILPISAKAQTPQDIGSAISYARRYALAAMVGVYQTDDDAEAAMAPHRPTQKAKPEPIYPTSFTSKEAAMNYVFEIGVHEGKSVKSLPKEILTKYLEMVVNRQDGSTHPSKSPAKLY